MPWGTTRRRAAPSGPGAEAEPVRLGGSARKGGPWAHWVQVIEIGRDEVRAGRAPVTSAASVTPKASDRAKPCASHQECATTLLQPVPALTQSPTP